jgi:hypothetical protein
MLPLAVAAFDFALCLNAWVQVCLLPAVKVWLQPCLCSYPDHPQHVNPPCAPLELSWSALPSPSPSSIHAGARRCSRYRRALHQHPAAPRPTQLLGKAPQGDRGGQAGGGEGGQEDRQVAEPRARRRQRAGVGCCSARPQLLAAGAVAHGDEGGGGRACGCDPHG